jgi:hypothetical protein
MAHRVDLPDAGHRRDDRLLEPGVGSGLVRLGRLTVTEQLHATSSTGMPSTLLAGLRHAGEALVRQIANLPQPPL